MLPEGPIKTRSFPLLFFLYCLFACVLGTSSANSSFENLSRTIGVIKEGTQVTSVCDASGRRIKTGLNNALWYVGQYIEYCCEKQSMDDEGHPPCSSVTILPAIYPDLKLSMMNKPRRRRGGKLPLAHDYDDLFDVDRLTQGIINDHKCCVMSEKSWRKSISSRLLILHRKHAVVKVPPRIGRYGDFRGRQINDMGAGPYLLSIYKHLQISNTILQRLSPRCKEEWRKFGHEGFQAVHMRIEKDFSQRHCKEHEKMFQPEVRWCFTSVEISCIIKNTPGALVHPHTVLLYAADRLPPDETADPITLFRQIAGSATTPSEMNCLSGFSYTEQSAISLAIAISADTFIGTPRSTMSTGIALQRQVSPAGGNRVSYYYGCNVGKYLKATAVPNYEINNFNLSGAVKGCDYI